MSSGSKTKKTKVDIEKPSKRGRPRKKEKDKANKNDSIYCDVCGDGTTFTRGNRSKHCKTRIHQANLKMLNLLKEARMKELQKKPMTLSEYRKSQYAKKIIKKSSEESDDPITEESDGSDFEEIKLLDSD